MGPKRNVSGELFRAIQEGVAEGLRVLPGRPMAIMGCDEERLDQSGGLDPDPAALVPTPVLIRPVEEDVLRLHILMEGGGPAIRGKAYRVFHKHDVAAVRDEIVRWATEAVEQLGCTPCTLAVGIGRSHFEAASMMMQAQVYGKYSVQNPLEASITEGVNASGVGALGLGGSTTVLATFLKVGPQRASGVRIVCMRPCCCFEPRIASVEL
jgi:fumarate hydratase subunit alpha